MTQPISECSALCLTNLPQEVLFIVLSHLDVHDLLQCSRACHIFRTLAADPILRHERLVQASRSLKHELARRKPRAALAPPNAWIWLSKTNVLSRSISRSLIRIRLTHRLDSRPSTRDLVARAILPACATYVSAALIKAQQAVYKNRLRDGLCKKLERRPSVISLVSLNILPEECMKGSVAPALLETRRRIIKEGLKDGLRAWVENRGLKAQHRRALELEDSERSTVKLLIRRLTARKLAEELECKADAVSMEKKKAQARFGRALEAQRRKEEMNAFLHPTRAHVLHLKRVWEDIIQAAST